MWMTTSYKTTKNFRVSVHPMLFGIFFITTISVISLSYGDEPHKLLIISLDGFRWDYIYYYNDKLSNFRKFLSDGVHSLWLESVFRSELIPSHMSMITGLSPEHHGLTDSAYKYWAKKIRYENFYDGLNKILRREFWQNASRSIEPIWIRNEIAGGTSGVFGWPLSGNMFMNKTPHIHDEAHARDIDSFREKINAAIAAFISSSTNDRINLGMLYFAEPDITSHKHGPLSKETMEMLVRIDDQLGYLMKKIENNGLNETLNIAIVSDHGMMDLRTSKGVYLWNFIEKQQILQHLKKGGIRGGQTALILYPKTDYDYKILYKKLTNINTQLGTLAIKVYKPEHLPNRMKFPEDADDKPIIVVSQPPFVLLQKHETVINNCKPSHSPINGDHGYDPAVPEMRGIFLAKGPAFRKRLISNSIRMIDLYEIFCRALCIPPKRNDGAIWRIKNLFVKNYCEDQSLSHRKQHFKTIKRLQLQLKANDLSSMDSESKTSTKNVVHMLKRKKEFVGTSDFNKCVSCNTHPNNSIIDVSNNTRVVQPRKILVSSSYSNLSRTSERDYLSRLFKVTKFTDNQFIMNETVDQSKIYSLDLRVDSNSIKKNDLNFSEINSKTSYNFDKNIKMVSTAGTRLELEKGSTLSTNDTSIVGNSIYMPIITDIPHTSYPSKASDKNKNFFSSSDFFQTDNNISKSDASETLQNESNRAHKLLWIADDFNVTITSNSSSEMNLTSLTPVNDYYKGIKKILKENKNGSRTKHAITFTQLYDSMQNFKNVWKDSSNLLKNTDNKENKEKDMSRMAPVTSAHDVSLKDRVSSLPSYLYGNKHILHSENHSRTESLNESEKPDISTVINVKYQSQRFDVNAPKSSSTKKCVHTPVSTANPYEHKANGLSSEYSENIKRINLMATSIVTAVSPFLPRNLRKTNKEQRHLSAFSEPLENFVCTNNNLFDRLFCLYKRNQYLRNAAHHRFQYKKGVSSLEKYNTNPYAKEKRFDLIHKSDSMEIYLLKNVDEIKS